MTEALHGETNSLSLKTEGYQWYKANQNKSERIIRINPGHTYSVNGSVNIFWAVASTCDMSAKSLKQKAKERMRNREIPEVATFDE